MKTKLGLFIGFAIAISFQAKADQVLVQKEARQVNGIVPAYEGLPERHATACTYQVSESSYNGAQEIDIRLVSDSAAGIAAEMIRLSPEQLPLHEGTLKDKNGLTLTYENGILKQMDKSEEDGLFNRDYKETQVAVSPDLQEVSAAYATKVTRGLFKSIKLFEMTCQF